MTPENLLNLSGPIIFICEIYPPNSFGEKIKWNNAPTVPSTMPCAT